ncbi:hypothetical protein [Chamaesiphon sp.]|uniref:hypothetical protein n=1 Tax=Chamaesiphon sp. TaxID=2814140 RepID=UPI003593DE5B
MKYQLAISIAIFSLIATNVPSMAEPTILPTGSQFHSRWLQAQNQKDLVVFPEVGLAIAQPPGFTKATSFYGFEQAATNSSIVLTKIPGPYSQVTGGFTKAGLATRGISLISKQNVKIENQSGLLLNVAQSAYGQKFRKWIVVFGDEQNTRLITATFPSTTANQLGAQLKKVVLAVSLRTSSAPVASSLPFTITAVEGLSPVESATGLGKVAAFTKDGNIPTAAPTDPLFIVAPSLGAVPVLDQKSFATRRLAGYPLTNTVVKSTTEIAIDNLTGWEIVADGRDRQTKAPLTIYQVVLYPQQGGYVLMTGIVGDKQAELYLPKFKAMALTYRNSPQ